MEAADADVEVSNGGRTKCVGVTDGEALAASVLSAAILAEAGAEWILRQAQQLPVGKASEYTVAGVDVLVHAADILIHVPAGAGRLDEIVRQSAVGLVGSGINLSKNCGRRIDATRRNDVARKRSASVSRWSERVGIDREWIKDGRHAGGGKVTGSFGGGWNRSRKYRA